MPSDPFIGEIMLWPVHFTPENWLPCDGRILQIEDYMALFSVLWNTYGGDGRTTFALPDLRGRIPMGYGSGPGLTRRDWGAQGGSETLDAETAQIAAAPDPANPGASAGTVNASGTSAMPPALALNFVICTDGVYPCRS